MTMSSHGPTHSLASMAPDLSDCTISLPGTFTTMGAYPPQDLSAEAGHPVAQPPERLLRRDLAGAPAAHLGSGVAAEERLDIELGAKSIPQFLTHLRQCDLLNS